MTLRRRLPSLRLRIEVDVMAGQHGEHRFNARNTRQNVADFLAGGLCPVLVGDGGPSGRTNKEVSLKTYHCFFFPATIKELAELETSDKCFHEFENKRLHDLVRSDGGQPSAEVLSSCFLVAHSCHFFPLQPI